MRRRQGSGVLNIHVWNVGHGEAIRIDFYDTLSIIRDFGRSSSACDTATSISVDRIRRYPMVPKNRKVVAILSHAHEDHFSGFRSLYDEGARGIFDEAFVPWFDFRFLRSLGWKMAILGSYIYAYYGRASQGALATSNWACAAPLMASLSKDFMGVSAGHVFKWPVPGQVIWPPPPLMTTGQSKDIQSCISDIEAFLTKSGRQKDITRVRDVASRICSILKKYFSIQKSDSPQGRPNEKGSDEDVKDIQGLLSTLDDIGIPRYEASDRIFVRSVMERTDMLDNHSVVFRIGNEAMFLSDLNEGPMNRMARLYLKRPTRYRFLKSSHHGTRLGLQEFKQSVKGVDTLVHCCGPANRGYKPPTNDYYRLQPELTVSTDQHPDMPATPPGYNYCVFSSPHRCFSL